VTDRSRLALRWALRLLGPVLLGLVLWRLPEPARVLELFAAASGWLLLASFTVNVVAIQLKVTRWQVMLRARAIAYSTKDAWLAFTASLYLAMLTPGRVGDVLRVQYLRHDRDVSYAEGLASYSW